MLFSFSSNSGAGGNDAGLDHIVTRAVSMLADARHSFDLATLAVLTDVDPVSGARDIRDTDQPINLAEQGVDLAGSAEIDSLLTGRQVVSSLFGEAGALLRSTEIDEASIRDFAARADGLVAEHGARIEGYMNSDRPGREVVPLAIHDRYLCRIVANLVGVLRDSMAPIHRSPDAVDGPED